ncbi:hypothetical protein AMS68_003823 [Peltaster fructicola]|uniref:Uncharacterized protein n=1 Tax=Peltaster fructicola TaxID=286661 RepID=A0A6H0XUE7_9PEZI|nr:hypothetical protein AMS68_003823 [Peltaster fructicola]
MRLLSRQGNDLRFSYYHDDVAKPYAILSHTWGADGDEVTYEDVCNNKAVDKLGFQKLDFCLQQAKQDGLEYVWIDTCCIDKKDRNELGEAINKMFSWYARAEVCYVYLADVSKQDCEITFVKSSWHKRGWTLQELVAPHTLRFYGMDRKWLGDRTSLHKEILQASSIDTKKPLQEFSIPERYAWSFARQTTKTEDLSYCMLGLLDVTLVFNYGESAVAARERLLAEVDSEHGKRIGREIRKMQAERDARRDVQLVPSLVQETAMRLQDKLRFDNMNARRETINTPYPGTCTWLLENIDYKRWLARETPLLWIKGKPGAGKSTLIRYAQMQSTGMQIDFYFNARGDELERSTYGMYRSLLHQILEKLPYLQDAVRAYIKGIRTYTGHPWVMNVTTVKDVLRFVIGKLESPVWCFIDALDECPTTEAQEMVHYFEEVNERALYICFASRYYPAMTIRNSAELHLECREQALALERYVDGRLAVEGYPQGADLKAQVIAKARGIFFWLVVVVRLLNEELENGSIYNVQRKLDELPAGLSELLSGIVHGPGNTELLCMSLQWILFSRRPLTREEYYLAVVTSLSEAGSADPEAWLKPWDSNMVTKEIMDKFVTSSSRGLAHVTKSTGTETVQFIHESVRDFFVKHRGLQKLYPPCQDLESIRHDALKTICYRYAMSLAAHYSSIANASVLQKPTIRALDVRGRALQAVDPDFRHSTLTSLYPLWTYATQHVFYHAERAAVHMPQDDFLREVDFVQWWKLFDFREFSQYSKVLQDNPAKELYILAAADASRLIRTAQLRCQTIPEHLSPLFIPVIRRSPETLAALLDCGANIEAVDTQQSTALLLSVSKEYYDLQICRMLLRRGADIEANNGCTALVLATQNKLIDAVELLLEHHANTEAKANGKTALVIAIDAVHIPITTILLRYGADPEARDSSGNTVLLMACKS